MGSPILSCLATAATAVRRGDICLLPLVSPETSQWAF